MVDFKVFTIRQREVRHRSHLHLISGRAAGASPIPSDDDPTQPSPGGVSLRRRDDPLKPVSEFVHLVGALCTGGQSSSVLPHLAPAEQVKEHTGAAMVYPSNIADHIDGFVASLHETGYEDPRAEGVELLMVA